MTLCRKSLMRLIQIVTILFALVSIFSIDASAQFYDLDVRMPDINVYQGTSNLEIPIYLRNYTDSVVAFELTIITNHPEIVQLDSHSFDTSGTLSSGWQYISMDSAYETGINIQALANTINPPFVNGIGYPQTGATPLIKIFADIGDLPDTSQSLTASLEFVVGLNDLGLSDEQGNLLGLSYEFYYDTLWYNCTEYFPGDTLCKTWEEV